MNVEHNQLFFRQVYDTIECYYLSEDRWQSHPRMSTPRDGLAASTYDGKIFVAGGKG